LFKWLTDDPAVAELTMSDKTESVTIAHVRTHGVSQLVVDCRGKRAGDGPVTMKGHCRLIDSVPMKR
jgi:hypothetical protein